MICPHCHHDLRVHRGERPVYDRRMVFRCACGCQVDGTMTAQNDGDR